MTTQYAKHRKTASIDASCSACDPRTSDVAAKAADTSTAGGLMVAATLASTVIFILSAYALQDIYNWYPQVVAQRWFVYDELLTAFSFLELVFGALAATLIRLQRSFRVAVALGTMCTLSGASAFVVTLIQPLAVLWESLLFYFLPLFITPLAGTVLTYLRGEG
jgi:hypothetical protein